MATVIDSKQEFLAVPVIMNASIMENAGDKRTVSAETLQLSKAMQDPKLTIDQFGNTLFLLFDTKKDAKPKTSYLRIYNIDTPENLVANAVEFFVTASKRGLTYIAYAPTLPNYLGVPYEEFLSALFDGPLKDKGFKRMLATNNGALEGYLIAMPKTERVN